MNRRPFNARSFTLNKATLGLSGDGRS